MRLIQLVKSIDLYNASKENHELLDLIRLYNHTIIDSMNQIYPLLGAKVLDVGASPHGYALEWCLTHRAAEYAGIGLDINEDFFVRTKYGFGRLIYMDSEKLSFADDYFDVIVTMSTFEHIANLGGTLSEFNRVLRRGGYALITFEPLWTSSCGHHLCHLGDISKLIPDWAHLIWNKNEMLDYLSSCWPRNAPITHEEAVEWIYVKDVINRKNIREIRKIITQCKLSIEWIVPMYDIGCDEAQLKTAIEKTCFLKDELMTKGLSILMRKQ